MQSTRNGLNNALNRLDNALRSSGWSDEARNYLLQQRKIIQNRIDLIDNVIGSKLNGHKFMEDQTNEFFKQIANRRADLLEKDCDFLSRQLSNEWERLRDVDQLVVIRIMIEEKQCTLAQIKPYLIKLMNSPDPYYRYEALNYIVELDGKNQRELLIRIFLSDPDLGNRNRALLLLSDTFRNQKDTEILHFALSIFEDPASTIDSRLIAGAAMMFQLNIPSDEDGRPAFWGDDTEEIQHTAIQRAVAETKEILSGTSKN